MNVVFSLDFKASVVLSLFSRLLAPKLLLVEGDLALGILRSLGRIVVHLGSRILRALDVDFGGALRKGQVLNLASVEETQGVSALSRLGLIQLLLGLLINLKVLLYVVHQKRKDQLRIFLELFKTCVHFQLNRFSEFGGLVARTFVQTVFRV
jgi:hypothetical protein